MMRMWIALALGLGLMAGCSDETTSTPGTDATAPLPDTVEPSDTNPVDTAAPGPCEGKTEGEACDDGDPCTLDDTCTAGACVGGSNDPCETDNPCEPGTCVAGEGCQYAPVADGTSCTINCFGSATCVAGTCQVDPESAVVCPEPSADQPCVTDLQCDQATGECTVEVLAPAGTACDVDSDLCTVVVVIPTDGCLTR